MQNKWLMASLGALLLFSGVRAQTSDSTFSIHGSLPGAPEGTVVYLSNPNISRDTFAKAEVHGGEFVLQGVLQDPNLYFVSEIGSPQHKLIFLDASSITLKSPGNDLAAALVKGSPTDEEYEHFEPIFAPFFNRLGELAQQLNQQRGTATFDSLLKGYRLKLDTLDVLASQYVKTHPASHISSFLLVVHMQVRQDYDWLEAQYSLLKPSVQKDFYGRILTQQIAKARIGKEGTMALDFTQPDVNGHPVTLSSFRGKYVLVDFWASWCGPCRMENPNVVKAYSEFKDKNFTILSISLDKEKNSWLKAISDDGLSWTQVSDLQYWSNAVAQMYNISSIPQNMLVDPNGRIVAKNLRGYDLFTKLREVLH
jgi:peroxiredoxin